MLILVLDLLQSRDSWLFFLFRLMFSVLSFMLRRILQLLGCHGALSNRQLEELSWHLPQLLHEIYKLSYLFSLKLWSIENWTLFGCSFNFMSFLETIVVTSCFVSYFVAYLWINLQCVFITVKVLLNPKMNTRHIKYR